MPYYAFLDAGMEVDLASIGGGEIPVEPRTMGLASGDSRPITGSREDTVAMAKLTKLDRHVGDVDISQIRRDLPVWAVGAPPMTLPNPRNWPRW